jgi:TonB family protein
VAETPAPSQKPEVAKPIPKPIPKPQAKSPSDAKPEPTKQAQAEPAPALRSATPLEARSAIEALRQRQAQPDQEKQAEVTRKQAASARVAALRDQLEQEETVGDTAITATGVQRVRLLAYQERLRAKIIETWILPLSAEQTRDLQATAQFQVTRNGQVVQLELVKPSGNTLFDASLLRAIRRASPLPALPDDYPLDVLEVEMRFRPSS